MTKGKELGVFIRQFVFVLSLVTSVISLKAQCPKLLDDDGNPAVNPTLLLCSKDPRTLFLSFDKNFGAYSIVWGDGSPTTNGTGYTTGNFISHNYAAGVNNFTVTITIPGPPNCVLTAKVVKEEPTTASIQVPFGGVTRACAPASLDFLNSSTNGSSNTTYIWDYGDGSPTETYGAANLGATVSHLYQRGTVDCGTKVTLTAFNFCNVRQGSVSVAEYSPILIWDLDKPAIDSWTLFCYPDTTVEFTNATDLNCVKPGEGNVEARTEYWRFIDYFGPGMDSVIDWRPFGPPRTMHYPGIGTYTVELRERSFCGEVSTTRTVNIIAAPIAGISANKDTICIGENITFNNTSTGPANIFRWNPGDGSGWQTFNGSQKTINYNTPGNYTVRLAVNVNGGSQSCKDTALVPVVVVADPVAKFTLSQSIGCDSLVVAFTNQSTGANNWSWNFGQGTTATVQHPPNIKYKPKGRYFVDLTVGSNQGCFNTVRDTIDIFNSPKVNIGVVNGCELANTVFSNTTIPDVDDPVTSWRWSFGDNTTSTQQLPTHTYANPGNYQAQLIASTPFCADTATVAVIIYPLPVANFSPNKTSGCSPLLVQFSNTSTGAVNYYWDFDDGSTSTQRLPNHTFVNGGTTNKIFQVRLISESANGCRDTLFSPITVYPGATANFDYTATNECVSLKVDFTNSSSGAVAYKWFFGDGDSSNAINPSHDYVNSGTFVANYTAILIATSINGCVDTLVKNVSVNPGSNFGFIVSPDSGCSPLQLNFTANAGAVSYSWLFPDGDAPTGVFVQKTFVNNGTTPQKFKIRLTAQNAEGCSDVSEQEVVVFPNPVAAFGAFPSSGCAPLSCRLENNSLGATTYEWDYGDGNFSFDASPTHNYTFLNGAAAPLNYPVILKAVSADGCIDTAMAMVRVFPLVYADFDTLANGCSPLIKTYTAIGGVSYLWNFGNGEIANTQSYTPTFINGDPINAAVFNIKLIATSSFGCTDTVLGVANVYPMPQPAFNPDKLQGCPPLVTTFTNSSAGGTVFYWNYGDGNAAIENALNHQHTFVNPTAAAQNYSVRLIAQNTQGCSDTTFQTVNVFPDVRANFVHDTIGCDPFKVKFFNTSQGATVYAWTLDVYGNSSLQEPQQVFENNTQVEKQYTIQLIATSGNNCSDTAFSSVHVYPKPQALFNLDKAVGCEPLEVALQNASAGATNYQWEYGLGGGSTTSDINQTRIYPNGTDSVVNYPIRLIALNAFGCSDTLVKPIAVYPRVVAQFDSIYSVCSPANFTFQDRSVGASFITWNFNNEAQSFNATPNHTFLNPGSTDEIDFVELIAENAYQCRDTLRREFTIYATPSPDFSVTPPSQTYPSASVQISNNTAGTWNYTWRFGDGTTATASQPGSKTYATWGIYYITLGVSSGFCRDSLVKQIEILPPLPLPGFNGTADGCMPVTVAFANTSQYGAAYLWDFGDGGHSTSINPTYTYYNPGIYTVTLNVTGFGGQTLPLIKVAVVKVHENAKAYFTYSPKSVETVQEPVDFINLSQIADSYNWTFGDGTSSNEVSPTHYYQTGGFYDVVLIANNIHNCPDTFMVNNAVEAIDGGKIELPTAFTPNPNGSSGGKYDPAVLSNDVFFPFNKDVASYKMEIFSRWGEKIFESNDVNIGWDGYFNGQLCQQDVYVYKVEAIFDDGRKYQKVGDITLLR